MFWNKIQKRQTYGELTDNYTWSTNLGSTQIVDQEFKESTYFKCIKRLSEDIGKVPLQLKQHTDNGEIVINNNPLVDLVCIRPNPFMSSFDFNKSMEAVRQHKGSSWALIVRDSNYNPIGLYPITVTRIIIDNIGLAKSTRTNPILIYYTCSPNLTEYNCLYSDVIHFKGMTLDGLNSIAVKDHLKDTIATNATAQSYQKDLFANGLTNKAVVQLTSDIKDKNELGVIQNKFNKMYTSEGRIFTVPAGYQVSPLNLNLADSQFAELKKMGAVDICTSLGIPPHMIGIMDGYNNNSLEQSNLSYLVNTLLILFETNEAEYNYKLLTDNQKKQGYYFQYNTKVLLRMDGKTQADVLTQYIQNSVLTPNEVRLEIGKDKLLDGDDLLASSGTLKIKDLYNTAKNNAAQQDNTQQQNNTQTNNDS